MISRMGKIPCVEIRRPESHGEKFVCTCRLAGFCVADEFDGAEDGETITLTLRTLSQQEFDALPEFLGW